MTNLILYAMLRTQHTQIVYIKNNTAYVNARWYRITCDALNGNEWELDKYIHNNTQAPFFMYTDIHGELLGNHKWLWNEKQQRYV